MNPRIEEFLENGYITKEAAERLEDFEGMLKEAGFLDALKSTILQTAKTMGPAMVGSAVGMFGADYLTKRHHTKLKQDQKNNLDASVGSILVQNKDLAENREKAKDRFHEIAHFAPRIATMPKIVTPIIRRTLNEGLNEKDIRNLVQIEAGMMQTGNLPKPTSARYVEQVVGPTITNMGTTYNQVMDSPDGKLNEYSREAMPHIMDMLYHKGLLPEDLVGLFANSGAASDEDIAKAQRFMENNPDFIMQMAEKHNLYDEINNISGMYKQGSADIDLVDIPMEKRAEMLADQYTLIKHAGLGSASLASFKAMIPSLMGLGAAALFGAAGGIVEQGVDLARSKKSNERVKNSWTQTQSKLKKMNAEGNSMASGVDYGDKETMRKAEEAFKVLVDVAPALAQNATIATPFVNRVVQQDGDITPDIIKQLAETQKNITSTRHYRSPFADSPMAQGFGRMFQAAGGGKAVDNVSEAIGTEASNSQLGFGV